MQFSKIKRFIVGEPLSSHMMSEEKIPKWKALAVLSSDALSSVAYATEEILIPLAAFSVIALYWSVPISLCIVALLIIVAASYWQTIEVYRSGGGAYTVASENLGKYPGLIAAASLLIDYVLTVSVSVAAGVSAVTSAFPIFLPFKIYFCFFVIIIITTLNLRGVRESATIFAFPTYIFIFSMGLMLLVGCFRIASGELTTGQPILHDAYPELPLFLLMRAFSSGCAALTGIEAISNGVPAFRQPAHKNAKVTLAWMAVILATLFFGVTALAHMLGVVPVHGEIAVSLLARKVFGDSFFYYLIQFSTAVILFLAANTSYAGFPWLGAILARDRFLPRQLAGLGDRLVFANSIIGLSVFSAVLIWFFNAETHSLIPLYAIGVFTGFTLSQAGMVRYHLVHRQQGWSRALIINLVGALTTFVVLGVISITKFSHGAWIIILIIPFVVLIFLKINAHYLKVGKELTLTGVLAPEHLEPIKHTVVVPISGVHRGVVEALRYALSISDDVRAIYVEIDSVSTERIQKEWSRWGHDIPFVVLRSPFRSIIRPVLEYLDDLETTHHRELITVVIPEFVTVKWWQQFLHNQTAFMIRAALAFKRGKVVTSVRYHLKNV